MKIDDTYTNYNSLLNNINNYFINFKISNNYNAILEHVTKELGEKYNFYIKKEFNNTINDFLNLIIKNDSIGSPFKCEIDNFILSPSNLRYIYHTLLIQSKISNWFHKDEINIIEIGGGYGGLCFYLKNIISNFKINYTIVDLPNANILQSMFLSKQEINCDLVSCFELNNLLNKKFDLVISNYCLSELSSENRKEYFNKVICYCDKEFYVWNSNDLSDLNVDKYQIEDERPQTNKKGYNKFIYTK